MFVPQSKNGTVSSTLSRAYGTLAGLGFIGAAVLAIPSTLLLEPRPPAESYLITVAGLFTGLVLMTLPWERMDPRWLHAVGVLATVQAAGAVAVFGQAYTAFFFLIAVAVAYMVPDRKGLLFHFIVIGIALFGPVVYGSASPAATVQVALVVYPLLALTGGTFAYIRQRVVADNRSYQLFAEETLALAQRIAGSPLPAVDRRSREELDLPAWSRLRVPARVSGAAAGLLAVPLLTATLAAAGVKLPTVATQALDEVGIDLPNQDGEQGGTPAPAATTAAGTGWRDRDAAPHEEPTPGLGADHGGSGDADAPAADSPDGVETGSQAVTGGPAVAPPAVGGSDQSDSLGVQGDDGSDGPAVGDYPSGIGDVLDDLLDGLGGGQDRAPVEPPE